MAGQVDRPTLASPAVVAGITPMAEPLAKELGQRFRERWGSIPRPCRLVQLQNDYAAEIGSALTEALNIRHLDNPFALAADGAVRRLGPQVVLVAAAAELPDGPGPIAQAAAAVRREFRRSGLAGRLVLLLYVGPAGGRLPEEGILEQIEALKQFDHVCVFSDSDARGRRMLPQDAISLAAQFLFYYLTEESIQSFVARLSLPGQAGPRRFAVGTGRIDLAEKVVQNHLRKLTRARLFDHLFDRSVAAARLPAAAGNGRITPQALRSTLLGACGNLTAVGAMARPSSQALADHLLSARLAWTAEITRQAVLAWAPPAPGKGRSWLAWLIYWLLWPVRLVLGLLGRLWRWLPGRKPAAPAQPPKPGPSPEELLRQLVEVEQICARIKRLELALKPTPQSGPDGAASPLEVALGQVPEIQAAVQRCLPEIEQLAWRLASTWRLEDLLSEDFDPGKLRQRADALCDEQLRLEQRGRLVRPEAHREFVRRALECVAPTFPGGAGPAGRLVLLPAPVADLFELTGCEKHVGRSDEIVLVVVQPVATMLPFPDNAETGDGDQQPHPPAVF